MSVQTEPVKLFDALRTVAVNGSYNASRALSKWFHRGVRLTSDGFQSVPLADATEMIGANDEPVAAIHLPLSGDLSGHILLTFPEKVAMALVDTVMQVPEGTTSSLGEVEQSCLQETGNIVSSAYANSLAKWLGLNVEPAAPTFGYDMASAILEPLLMDMAADSDEVFVAKTDFLLDGQRLQWGMMLMPSRQSLEAMEQRCQLDHVRQQALQTIAINGAFNASRAMSKWLKRGVKLSTKGFLKIPLGGLADEFGGSEPVVALNVSLCNQLHGHALFVIGKAHAKQMVEMLMGEGVDPDADFSELEQSCLEESGNIISSAFVNSWSTWLDIHLEPSAPMFVFDLPGAVIESVVAEQARVSDDVFLTSTDFIVDDRWLEFKFLLLPAPSAMRLIETACD